MPRMKRITVSGAVLEQEIFNVSSNTKKLKDTEPVPLVERTIEEKEAYNLRQSLKRFIRTVNTNFDPSAYYVTLTFDDTHLPEDFKEARRLLNNYIRRLQYKFPKMVAVAVMGRGKRNGRIHIHCIISGVDKKTIERKWTLGKVIRIAPLRGHNFYHGIDHGQDYTGLATYLFNHWTPEQGTIHRWRETKKTIKKPDKKRPTFPKRKYSLDKPPVTPKGYILVDKRESGHYLGGYLCFKYVKIPTQAANSTTKMTC